MLSEYPKKIDYNISKDKGILILKHIYIYKPNDVSIFLVLSFLSCFLSEDKESTFSLFQKFYVLTINNPTNHSSSDCSNQIPFDLRLPSASDLADNNRPGAGGGGGGNNG